MNLTKSVGLLSVRYSVVSRDRQTRELLEPSYRILVGEAETTYFCGLLDVRYRHHRVAVSVAHTRYGTFTHISCTGVWRID